MDVFDGADLVALKGIAFRVAMLWLLWELILWQLRRLDGRIGISWRKDVVPLLESSGVGMGLYMGARFLALAILFSRAIP